MIFLQLKSQAVKLSKPIFRRLLSASTSGRRIEIATILKHELSPVPLSLAAVDGTLKTPTDKASLLHILADEHIVRSIPVTDELTCCIIDAMATVRAIGRPKEATTFGDLGDIFCRSVLGHLGNSCSRVDVVFDTYIDLSIKSVTRQKRSENTRKIRRIVDSRDVQLPPHSSWPSFIGLQENKVNLENFLAEQILLKAESLPAGQEVVVAGGREDPTIVTSSIGKNVLHLHSSHEEADTRMLLHAADAKELGYHRLIFKCRANTDVLVLLVCKDLGQDVWMWAGTYNKPMMIPIHDIRASLSTSIIKSLPAFHAITGCDFTSQMGSYGKKSAWKVYITKPNLLQNLGRGEEIDIKGAEQFIIR
jgi:hypothetical protein